MRRWRLRHLVSGRVVFQPSVFFSFALYSKRLFTPSTQVGHHRTIVSTPVAIPPAPPPAPSPSLQTFWSYSSCCSLLCLLPFLRLSSAPSLSSLSLLSPPSLPFPDIGIRHPNPEPIYVKAQIRICAAGSSAPFSSPLPCLALLCPSTLALLPFVLPFFPFLSFLFGLDPSTLRSFRLVVCLSLVPFFLFFSFFLSFS